MRTQHNMDLHLEGKKGKRGGGKGEKEGRGEKEGEKGREDVGEMEERKGGEDEGGGGGGKAEKRTISTTWYANVQRLPFWMNTVTVPHTIY